MKSSEAVVAALAEPRRRHSDANRDWVQSGLFGATYPALLVETYHYVRHSIPLLSRACSLLAGRQALQRYLITHMDEEVAHEAWALDDLAALGIEREQVIASEALPDTIRLVATQFYLIEHVSPVAILGYIYALESMPPQPRLLEALTEVYAIPDCALTFLRGHGAADLVHHREILNVIDDHVSSSAELTAVIRAAVMAVDNLDNLFRAIRRGDFVDAMPVRDSSMIK